MRKSVILIVFVGLLLCLHSEAEAQRKANSSVKFTVELRTYENEQAIVLTAVGEGFAFPDVPATYQYLADNTPGTSKVAWTVGASTNALIFKGKYDKWENAASWLLDMAKVLFVGPEGITLVAKTNCTLPATPCSALILPPEEAAMIAKKEQR